ncbi:UNVERIFIED_CONTAM: hypothetical protein Sindi_1671000 [Sesamum indicum]
MEEVIEGGPWLFQGQPIVLQKWEPGMAMRKLKHTQIPIWIKLRHLPMEYWTTEGLSTVASGVGKPLYPDAITRACTRLDFARVCVMLDVTQTLRKHIIIMTPNEDGGETPCKIDVEYEWLPPKCTSCMTIGHMTKDCELNKPLKPTKPPVAVYIPKVNVSQPPPATEKNRKASNIDSTGVGALRKAEDDKHKEHNADKHNDRGKAVVLYNAFDALHYLDDTDEPPRVLIHATPLDVIHVESSYYASVENRIWIAWDDNLLDVDILDLGEQFIHCRITIKALHESCIITIAYGASEVIDRRTLWHTLGTLAPQCSNDPWLVGGDFNAVCDQNEVCGISGDIRIAMEEFNAGIQEAGLLQLPMQGECLLPRTSDHSPLVLHGDSPQHNGGMFWFDNYLANSADFIPSVQNIWQHEVIGVPMYEVTRKLKALKQVFRQQRRSKGDLTRNVQLAKDFLDEAQTLVSSDRQNELFLYLEHCCRMVYAKAAKTEQIMLQQRAKMQWMKDGDQCSRVFFRKIAHRKAARRILQINDEHGNRRRTLVDINYLRPWARHIISTEEANHLLSPFSQEEVKLAVFDIAEDKAPGPDGYASRFYKAAWPVVGAEVTRAAYDTVEWDFLIATLHLFGFPPSFTRWIEECVTMASFFIGLSGTPHGFFTGARGLRQGDPLSPYLFVLVMEVLHLGLSQLIEQDLRFTFHWKCEPARIFQLGFADDLILFCKADKDSVRTIKVGLARFAEWSGLRLNIQKSHLIISRSAQERKEQLLSILGFQEGHLPIRYLGLPLISSRLSISGFQEGHLPMRYLGLPLISSRLSISDCQPLLSKIETRIAGWEGMSLSYAGRVQIIKTVLSALSLYWASAFILPKAVIKEVEKRLRVFLWKALQAQAMPKLRGKMFANWWWKGDRLTANGTGLSSLECLQIIYTLPLIHVGEDRIIWRFPDGRPTAQALYQLLCPPGPKVGWTLLLSVAIDYGHGVLRDYSHTASYLWRIRSDYLEIDEWEPHHSGALSAYDATGTESRLDFTTFRPSEDSSSYVHPVACDSGEAGHNG